MLALLVQELAASAVTSAARVRGESLEELLPELDIPDGITLFSVPVRLL